MGGSGHFQGDIYILTTAPLEYTNTKTTQNGPFIFGISSSGGATLTLRGTTVAQTLNLTGIYIVPFQC